MPPLPIVSGAECIAALKRGGFVSTRQKGSHVRMEHAVSKRRVTVPLHSTLKRGTLSGILSDAGLTVAEFLTLLGR